jgi:hypothetical protein
MEVELRQPSARLIDFRDTAAESASYFHHLSLAAFVLLCPESLEPCPRSACTRVHCERTDEALLVLCWQCGSLSTRNACITVCVECDSGRSAEPHDGG